MPTTGTRRLRHQSGLPFDVRETKRLRARIAMTPLSQILNPKLRQEERDRRHLDHVKNWRRARKTSKVMRNTGTTAKADTRRRRRKVTIVT